MKLFRCNLCDQEIDNRSHVSAIRGKGLVQLTGKYQGELMDHSDIHICVPCDKALMAMYKEKLVC